jgi:transcriptional regulator with XRE-family HTH domain
MLLVNIKLSFFMLHICRINVTIFVLCTQKYDSEDVFHDFIVYYLLTTNINYVTMLLGGGDSMKNNFKTAREAKGLTQKECADKLGITLRAWQTYEQGVSEPKQELLCKIADMFDVSLDYLLGREPAPNPFADLGLDPNDEKAVIDCYMSLDPQTRAILLDTLRKLASEISEPEEPAAMRQSEMVDCGTVGEFLDRREQEAEASRKDAV